MFYTIFVTSLLIIPFWECNVTGTPSVQIPFSEIIA